MGRNRVRTFFERRNMVRVRNDAHMQLMMTFCYAHARTAAACAFRMFMINPAWTWGMQAPTDYLEFVSPFPALSS